MVDLLGVDYSFSRPGGAAIKAAGYEFAMRYVPYPGDGGKGLTLDEARDLHANGIAIGLVFESTAGRALDGYQAGVADAQMVAAVPWIPATVPIYFAVDFDMQPDQLGAVANYFRGCASVLGAGRVGVYGSYTVCKQMSVIKTASGDLAVRWFWQTYAWSDGALFGDAHVYQYQNGAKIGTADIDLNKAWKDDCGLWEAIDMAVLDEIKAVLVGNGIDVEVDAATLDLCPPGTEEGAMVRLTGEQAWQYAVRKGWSLGLGLGLVRRDVAALMAAPAGGIPEHTHTPGGVQKS